MPANKLYFRGFARGKRENKEAGTRRPEGWGMCGIVGYIGSQEAEPILVEGLAGWSTAATTARDWRR